MAFTLPWVATLLAALCCGEPRASNAPGPPPPQATEESPALARARELLSGAREAQSAQDFGRAQEQVEEALELMLARDERDQTGFDFLFDLAQLAEELGDLGQAERASRAALGEALELFGEEHPDTALARMWVADFLSARGRLEEARALGEQALAVLARALPEEHPQVLGARGNLAITLYRLGELSRARALQELTLATLARVAPEDDHARVTCEMNLGITLASLGDLARARGLLEHVFALRARSLDAESPHLQLARQNFAVFLSMQGDDEGARALQQEVIASYERTLPDDNLRLQSARQSLATTLLALGERSAARELFARVLAVRERVLPEGHPEVQSSLTNLAVALRREGDLDGARRLQERVLVLRERTLRPGDLKLAAARSALVLTLGQLEADAPGSDPERPPLVRRLAHDFAEDLALAARSVLLDASIREAEERIAARDADLGKALSFAAGLGVLAPDPELERAVFLVSESMRAAALASARVARTARAAAGWTGGQVRRAAASEELARLAQIGAPSGELERVREELEQAERELVLLAASAGALPAGLLAPELELLAARLDADAALVSYRCYGRVLASREPPRLDTTQSLCAFVLRRGVEPGAPARLARVELGLLEPIEAAVEAWRAAVGARPERGMAPDPAAGLLVERGESLRALVLDPLRPALGDARRLVVVPDGVLHVVPLDALPAGDFPGAGGRAEPLGARLALELRSSALELLDEPEPSPEGTGLVALGGASYDGEPLAFDAEEGDELARTGADRERGAAWERAFGALPETRAEIHAIAEYFEEAFEGSLPTVLLERRGASRASLFQRAPGARFLHVATHGWFAPESVRSLENPEALDPSASLEQRAGGGVRLRGMRPMLLCGLALAGANLPADAAGRLPGLVTAEELATLDLAACELAVLSACDTNVGERRAGQGVASLQRALHMAGARTVVTSSWRVPDEATRELMVDFYRRVWLHHTPKARALQEAKLRLYRARDASGGPRYTTRDWAAWVLSGDPR